MDQSHLGINRYVVAKSQIGWFFLRTIDVANTSQIGQSHSRTSYDVVMTSQNGPLRPDQCETGMRRRYEVTC